MENKTRVPILLVIFNRPKSTERAFEAIRKARPKTLFISADGPKNNDAASVELCRKTREITEKIDWDCQVWRKYSETNIGLDPHVISAVNWMFEKVEEGMVLEDDCVPNQTFFGFCEKLLKKYKNDERVMHINGSNFQFGNKRGDGSYYFSKYAHSWGWATWKRAWLNFDPDLKTFPEFRENLRIDTFLTDNKEKKYWLKFFADLYNKKYSFWDSRWLYSIWDKNGIVITPNVNLITNIGSGVDASHTILKEKIAGQETMDIVDVSDPAEIAVNEEADKYTFKVYYYKNFFQKVFYKLAPIIIKLIKK